MSRWLGSSAVDGFEEPRMAARGGERSFADVGANGEVAPIPAVRGSEIRLLVH